MNSSAEFYTSKEESRNYDDFQSENSFYASDGDDIYDQKPPSKLYEEEESNSNDEILSDEEIDESDGHDRKFRGLLNQI